ncbi:circadian clock-controlled protein daywake-like [Aricia agestis]|uniref:circadian clock-controlled protein daywake-like n=1 Tax=Aricia agestis TaxID=91739 RepID=UPI001C208379|nr:circadian clock-controlled protein daywake-like [Aricia agestis]
MLLTALLAVCCASGALATAVPFIKPCPIDDSPCILKAANAALPKFAQGRPEMGIEPLEPMYIKRMVNDNAGLKLTFTDNYIKGMSTCTISNLKSEILSKKSHTLTFKCPSIVIDGDYRIDGQLLLLTIQGHGKFKIDLRDVILKVTTQLGKVTGADGKQHFNIESWKNSFKVQTSAHFDFENLFNGNEVIAKSILEFMNTNWKDVLAEAGEPIHKAITGKAVEVAQKLYNYSSDDELYVL